MSPSLRKIRSMIENSVSFTCRQACAIIEGVPSKKLLTLFRLGGGRGGGVGGAESARADFNFRELP